MKADGSDRRTTLIGHVASVRGGQVRVRLRDTPTTLVLVNGESYRVGQIGAFLRIPLGYNNLYGVCTQVGADASPVHSVTDLEILEVQDSSSLAGYRWLTLVLFGEEIGGQFDRGVGQYPTIGDEVHLATARDLDVIYSEQTQTNALSIGRIAGSSSISARLDLSTLVSRHACIVGSTGAGKSNLVAVILDALSGRTFQSARLLVIDPHGEYSSAVGDRAHVVRTGVNPASEAKRLRVPYWALPFDELITMCMGDMQPNTVESLRDRVRDLKVAASGHLAEPPPIEAITADSPIPFSIRRLWFELEEVERSTFRESNRQDDTTLLPPTDAGDASTLRPPSYPPATSVNTAPYHNRARRQIGRQLDLLRTRLLDSRFTFMFDPADALHPDLDGRVTEDLASLLADWVGSERPVTVVDVSAVPSEVLTTVVGTMLRIVYDALFWAMDLPVGGREQPLLVIVDEAHLFLPAGGETATHRTLSRIAKEGRKYGVGLMLVSQRPSDVDPAVLSQCGTTLALRLTNAHDRAAVSGSISDDLGGLTELLPSLRTGEALVLGAALQVPSRVRIFKARQKPVGDDPDLPSAWQRPSRPDPARYDDAVRNWRSQSTTGCVEAEE